MRNYFVSRQTYWHDSTPSVEIAARLDYAGPDMLTPKFEGEGCEYDNINDAVEAAIEIRKSWAEELEDHVDIRVAMNDLVYPTDDHSDFELRQWAIQIAEKDASDLLASEW